MSAETNTGILDGSRIGQVPIDPRVVELLGENELWNQLVVIGIRSEERAVESYVPHELVDSEEVAVGFKYAESLAAQMSAVAEANGGGTGQTTPIVLGYIEGEDRLKIMDGFHRDAGLILNGSETVYATIKKVTWDELYDFRIFNAKENPHVRFSRVVQWMKEVWGHSGLNHEISLRQAILLTRFDTDGSKHKLDQGYVEKVKDWIGQREKQWGLASMTILEFLKISDTVDPKLVHSAREKTDGKVLEAPTQSILKIFSREIPDDFELQNLVMEVAMAHNLKGPEVTAVCRKVKDCDSIEAAREDVEQIDWDKWEPAFAETKQRQLRRRYDPRHKGAKVLDAVGLEIESIINRTKVASEAGEPIDPTQRRLLIEAANKATELQRRLGYMANLATGLATRRDMPKLDNKLPEKTPVARRAPQPAQPPVIKQPSPPAVKPPAPKPASVGLPAVPPAPEPAPVAKPAVPKPEVRRVEVKPAPAPEPEPAQEPIPEEPPSPETLAHIAEIASFKQSIRDYMNEVTDDLPPITDKKQLHLIERVMREAFSGDPRRIGHVQEAVDEFRYADE